METDESQMSTRCIHAGDETDDEGATHTPLYNHSTFAFPDTDSVLDVVEGRTEGNLYTRYGLNPTLRSVEEKLASIEGGEGALVFGSGMAAESATFLSHCDAGDRIVCVGDVYGGTYDLLASNLPELGIETTFLLGDEIDRLESVLDDRTRLVFFESVTNPNMEVLDIERIAAATEGRDVLTVVDNTFATPVNTEPLEHGADLVVHSTTKYMGGHSDLTGGAVVGPSEYLGPIGGWRKNLGQTMAPKVAFLLARSLRTLAVRVEKHNEHAGAIARRLNRHPRVVDVNYPGLESHGTHDVAEKQMRGYGGMLSFVVDEDARGAADIVDRLEIFAIAASLGGVESLVTQPVTTTHHGLDPEERQRRGIVDGMIRLSIGLEDVDDLWGDLETALEA
ncbi:MAG: PLP-dependent aspartate aminotransferase family protein [Bradymonadaceae bacterium]